MSRYARVDADAILDAAERLLLAEGVAALSIDRVAREAGVSKGGVQSRFGSRDNLIDSLFRRSTGGFLEVVQRLAGPSPTPLQRLGAYVTATAEWSAADARRAAGTMAALLQAPEQLAPMRDWYAAILSGLDSDSEQGRAARLAFFATEGAFLLRYLGLMTVSEEEWNTLFQSIHGAIAAPGSRTDTP